MASDHACCAVSRALSRWLVLGAPTPSKPLSRHPSRAVQRHGELDLLPLSTAPSADIFLCLSGRLRGLRRHLCLQGGLRGGSV
ncbi:hypothetical protein EON64_17655 [archaeon]|nr:MAG: hypothetical protein EON64_17655 [archaeon]